MPYRDISLIAKIMLTSAIGFLVALAITLFVVDMPKQVDICGVAVVASLVALGASLVGAWADGKDD